LAREEPAERLRGGRKFFALVEPSIGQKRAGRIVDLVWKLDEAKNVDEVMKALEMSK